MHRIWLPQKRQRLPFLPLLYHLSSFWMKQYSSELKDYILSQHASNPFIHSFSSLAASLVGGVSPRQVRRWYQLWDGTQESLERREGSGRPRLLSKRETNTLIRVPIMNKNRSHQAVHYPPLQHSIKQKTGKEISIQTTSTLLSAKRQQHSIFLPSL